MEKLAKGFLWLAALSVMVVSGCAEDQSSGEPGANYRATQPAIDYSTTMALVAQARQDPDTHAIAALTELDWQSAVPTVGTIMTYVDTGLATYTVAAAYTVTALAQMGSGSWSSGVAPKHVARDRAVDLVAERLYQPGS